MNGGDTRGRIASVRRRKAPGIAMRATIQASGAATSREAAVTRPLTRKECPIVRL